MADTMRWRYGETNPILLPVSANTEIKIGDLVYLDTDNAKPASALADAGSKAANQEAFHDQFAGVAMQRSRTGDTTPIRIATSGVFELECSSAAFEVGALVGADQPGGATALSDQQVAAVATENLAVGRCAKRLQPAGTQLLVDIVSTMLYGGPQAKA